MMKKEELQAIAAQLKHPTGEKGIEMANMMHETNINMTRHSVQNLHVISGNAILELGHGNAGHLEYVLEQAQDLTYYGLEMSELMCQEAQQINIAFVAKKQAHFSLYNGTNIPFEEASFDKIFTVNTIYFWQEPEKLLSEIYRVLKPEGTFCITFAEESFMKQLPFTQFEFNLYSTEKAESLIEKTAFQVVHKETLTEKVKSKMGELVDRAFTTLVLGKR
ncbi:class I SAM-dependent methyltransferase [Flavobacterium sp. UGB4466]|uniref:class I SAM-dependent methyltransferase n=1 Tax=Flavobacterium sp. UGB4466 TaxID=2730889 RepID=UPI001ED91A8C|nr:class I SAM-dependent methyltransferase [Flavobacterium sp. UGB4466]